jgi:hypothetical protein
MSARNSNNDNNPLFKNENLKNMLHKLSEEAKKQFTYSNVSNSSRLNELLNTKFFIEEDNLKKNYQVEKFNFNLENEENNENFTQEFYMERYKNYIPSNIVTPADFNANFNKDTKEFSGSAGNYQNKTNILNQNKNYENCLINQTSHSNVENQNLNFFEIFFEKLKSDSLKFKSNHLNLENWIKCFNELHANNKEKKIHLREFLSGLNLKEKKNFIDSILIELETFFSKYTIHSDKEIIIGEITDIKFMDNLQIITIKDFNSYSKDVVIVEENSDGINLNSSIKDDSFQISEIILLKRNSMRLLNPLSPYNSSLSIISFNNIKQLN